MSDEIPMKPREPEQIAEVLVLQDTLDKFISTADVQVVYGEPIQHGDTLILPTAEIVAGLGFGIGYGSGRSNAEEGESTGNGGGGGGGGRVLSRPVAVVVASPEGVRVEPVVDITKIGLAAITAAGFMFGMILRMTGSQRTRKE
jgi:uncharacterized spore protein YtfJ